MIIAVTGRRVDAGDTGTRRFPLENRDLVYDRLRALFLERGATAVVGSGACGVDLLAMQAAGDLGLDRYMILPFEKQRFRDVSVTDRPGDWGPLFDKISTEVKNASGLVVLSCSGNDQDAFLAAVERILSEACSLAQAGEGGAPTGVLAVAVWDGTSRGHGDVTAAFIERARARGLPVAEISTLH